MKKFGFLIIAALLFACDDPSLNQGTDDDSGILEPIDNLERVASIQITNASQTLINDISISYNPLKLIESVTFTNPLRTTTLDYNTNNSLRSININNNSVTQNHTVQYINDQILLTRSTNGTTDQTKRIFTDQQNRTNRIEITNLDATGSVVSAFAHQFIYNANSNLTRFNVINLQTNQTIAYKTFTYSSITRNAFTNMNDIVRLVLFEDFLPVSRNMQVSQLDYDTATVLSRSINTVYANSMVNYPLTAAVTTTQNGTNTSTVVTYNYLP